MKTKLLLPLLFSIVIFTFCGGAGLARAQETPKPSAAVLIDALKQEISLFKMLLGNLAAKQNAISSPAYIAVDLESKKTLLSKNPEQVCSIASITKMMNAVVARENIADDKRIIINDAMLAPLGGSPTIYKGLVISAQNLLRASLIQSTNDAAEALAQTAGKEKFLALMNQKAAELGMANTAFYDSCGLDPKNQSTPADLAKLVAYVHKNHPEILAISKSNDFWLNDKSGNWMKFQNVNNFYPVSAFLGGKTGYLPEAKQAIASVFEVNKKPVAIVVLYSANRQNDVFRILEKL